MQIIYFLLAGLIGYLCGSVPFGYIYVRLFKGEDLTKMGSGRTGAPTPSAPLVWASGY